MEDLKQFINKLKSNLGISISMFMHLILFSFLIFNLPQCQRKNPPEVIISLDLLPISDVTNIENKQNKVKSKQQDKIKEEKPKPVQEPIEEKAEAKPEPKAEPKPEAEQKPEPEKKPEPKPEAIPEPKPEPEKKPEIRKPETKPKPEPKKSEKKSPTAKEKKDKESKKKKSKQKTNEYDALLKDLLAETPQSDEDEFFEKPSKGPHNPGKKLSMSIKDSIKRQIERCWSPPAGNKDAGNLQVLLEISFQKDGTVSNAEIVNTGRYQGDEMYKVAADAALRAVYKCSPLEGLPVDQYNLWGHIEFNFDPSGLIY